MKKYPLIVDFRTASTPQKEAAMAAFIDDLLCEDYAKWLKIEPTDQDFILAVSFHDHPLVPDPDAQTLLIPRPALTKVAHLYGGVVHKMAAESPLPAVQVACENNLEKLRAFVRPNSPVIDVTNVHPFHPR